MGAAIGTAFEGAAIGTAMGAAIGAAVGNGTAFGTAMGTRVGTGIHCQYYTVRRSRRLSWLLPVISCELGWFNRPCLHPVERDFPVIMHNILLQETQ